MVIWVTGLAGAGKSTFAKALIKRLRKELRGVVHLDGDCLRNLLGKESTRSYTRSNRLKLAKIYANLAKSFSEQNLIVVVSTISLFNEIHSWNRSHIKQYIEILLNPSLQTLKKRDQKNLYSNNAKGLESNVIGLDIEVDFPLNPDFQFSDFSAAQLTGVANEIIETYGEEQIGN